MAQNLETGLIINKLTGDTVGLNVQNSDALINNVTVGKGNLVGFGNTVVGQSAMTGNTSFQYSTAIGYQSLKDNQSSNNTAIGANSLSKNTTGTGNIAIGNDSLNKNTTGSSNIAIGNSSLLNLSNGGENICIGSNVFISLTAGTKNTVIADGVNVIETNNNTIVGSNSLSALKSGGDNTTLGVLTLNNATASTQNTSVGYYSQRANIDGNYNTSLGAFSLEYNKKGSYNTSVGYGSGPTASYSALTNTTCLGANSTVTKDNSVILGNPSDTNIMVGIGTSAPSEKLEVSGKTKTTTLQVTNGATAGYVLTATDNLGNMSWQAPTGGGGGTFTGGTVVGGTSFTNGLTANTFTIGGVTYNSLTNLDDTTNLGTGITIHFSARTIFNLPDSPASGNISGDTTNAKFGMVQKIYHQSSIEPTFQSNWKLIGEGVYFTNQLNIIYAEYITNSRIEYWIIQEY